MTKSSLKSIVKECVVEVLFEDPPKQNLNEITDPQQAADWLGNMLQGWLGLSMGLSVLQLAKFHLEKKKKEEQELGNSDIGDKNDKLNEFKLLVKECVIEVLEKDLEEGFDPTSCGPRPEATEGSTEMDYEKINQQMAHLQETDPHGNYAQEAGAGQFDPRTFGPTTKTPQL